jgi:two-component system, NtrC family, nitrogen regulation sensor histidine kinase NtrY
MIQFANIKAGLRILIILMVVSMIAGLVSEWIYHKPSGLSIDAPALQEAIQKGIAGAEQDALQLKKKDYQSADIEREILKLKTDRAYYLIQNQELVFWSSNQFVIDFSSLKPDGKWHYTETSNLVAIYRHFELNDSLTMYCFIPLRMAYPYENQYLFNQYFSFIPLSEEIVTSALQQKGEVHINDDTGRFLFSVSLPAPVAGNDKNAANAGFIFFSIAFLSLMLIYVNIHQLDGQKKISITRFLIYSGITGIIILINGILGFPETFFNNRLFSPHQYAVSGLISSFTHLSVWIIFLFSALYLYYQRVKISPSALVIHRLLLIAYLYLFYQVLRSLVIHSGIQFNILQISDFNFISIWAHGLVFLMATALSFLLNLSVGKKMPARLSKFSGSLSAAAIYYLVIVLISTAITLSLNSGKKTNKYSVLTSNIMVNGISENDPIAELLLGELNKQLMEDTVIAEILSNQDSALHIQSYIYDKHLRGFWNKFDIHTFSIKPYGVEYENYKQFVQFSGKRIADTHFYSLPGSLYDLSYLGMIPYSTQNVNLRTEATQVLILEFQAKRNFRSYSFPDLLVNNNGIPATQPGISIARYEGDKLAYSDHQFEWKELFPELKQLKSGFSTLTTGNRIYYAQVQEDEIIILTEKNQIYPSSRLYYLLVTWLSFVVLSRFFYWLNGIFGGVKRRSSGLTSRFQWAFISLLLISFLGIFIFSVDYIRGKYQEEQVRNAEQKKRYIQNSLQDSFYWTTDLRSVDPLRLNNALEELAYIYQTDINVYDNDGVLAGSSQNLVFSKHLISKLISPEVYFSKSTPGHQYEQIGSLEYLSSYTEMINGDYLRLGFISIPQYLSQNEINAEIENFMSAITRLYLGVLLLAVLLILLAGRQLSGPLHQLEIKLKSMHWGGRNEKIEYKWNDEIGQLVEQYNRTVDELEKSTGLLLQAERESAWRTMARQVAHEINNPLTPMKLTIQQLQRMKQEGRGDFEEYFARASKTLIEQIDNLSRIAGTFSQFARMPDTRLSRVDVADKLLHVVELYRNNHHHTTLSFEGPEKGVYALSDNDQIIQVFNNILKNAIQATSQRADGKIEVQLKISETEIMISISDNGPGIPDELREDIFRPGFTTKTSGMGLGLSITRNFVEYWGGKISFVTDSESGTTFTIKLPLEQ